MGRVEGENAYSRSRCSRCIGKADSREKSWKLKEGTNSSSPSLLLGGRRGEEGGVTVPLKFYCSGPGSHILLGTGALPAALLGGIHTKEACPPTKSFSCQHHPSYSVSLLQLRRQRGLRVKNPWTCHSSPKGENTM